MNSFGEATYWHNHPDLLRLAQNMREQLEQQRTTVYELPRWSICPRRAVYLVSCGDENVCEMSTRPATDSADCM